MSDDADSFSGRCPTCGQEYLADEILRLRKIAAKYELLGEDGDQCAELVATAYDEWDPDIPWFRQLDCAVAECEASDEH